jgi:dihydropyrimidinase
MKTLVRNGNVFSPHHNYKGDIYIEDGIVKEMGTGLSKECDNLIDAEGMIVIPGGVDVHTHLNLHVGDAVANDDFYTGTVAAACGGTTCIVDHMGFGPAGCSLHHQADVYHGYADGSAVIDYGFHGVVQHVDEGILHEMEALVSEEGISSFKIYLTYSHKLDDSDAYRVLKRLKELGGVAAVHCENDSMVNYFRDLFLREGKLSPIYHALSRPDECESEAVGRMISLSAMAGDAPLYIVHLSCESSLNHIRNTRRAGRSIFAETCPQYLLLDEDRYNEPNGEGLKYIMSPPLRNRRNQEALWEGIREGSIQVVATDHCPFSFSKDKQLGRFDFTKCPNGAPGVEERVPLMFSEGVMKGRIGMDKFVEVCCTNPAKIFGFYPRKGTIAPGSDADIVIIDPSKELTLGSNMLHGRADYTAYEGFKLKGYPVLTLSRGRIIARDNEFLGERGCGEYIKRKVTEGEVNLDQGFKDGEDT